MSDAQSPAIGAIGWVDLTVENAEELRDFYREVVGWSDSALDMGGYSDFVMSLPGSGTAVAGVCHARGENAALPPQWLIYITVADLDESTRRCAERGGEVIAQRSMGSQGRYCVIRDPAGAVAALFEPPRSAA
ncbi:MAG TPA: VOC family protein [Longimicrobiaceae bacterium]|nr:VOC family protein [Longimicrobiaceae bacterium]